MKTVIAYSKSDTFQLFVKEAKVTRRYEEKDYDFVASDLQLDLTDGQQIYDLVNAGEEIFVAIKNDDETKFYGVIQFEGASYNPEKEVHSFTALHISKKVFNLLKDPVHNAVWYSDIYGDLVSAEYVAFNIALYNLNFSKYADDPNYTMRDRFMDMAKHYRYVMSVKDDLSAEGKYQLSFQKKSDLRAIVHSGYDDLIAEYKEEDANPEYDAVIFPCLVGDDVVQFPTYVIFNRNKPQIYIGSKNTKYASWASIDTDDGYAGNRSFLVKAVLSGDEIPIPDNCLDLRVPSEVYGKTFPSTLPIQDGVPFFKVVEGETDYWFNKLLRYCDQEFTNSVSPYKEITVLYSEMLQVNPCETLNVREQNIVLHEVEDDHAVDTTQVIGRKYL